MTLHRILMVKVKACSRHASTLKQRIFFNTLSHTCHLASLAISFALEDTLETIKSNQVKRKSVLKFLDNGNDDGDGNENGKKSNMLRQAKRQLYKCITLFCTFLCHRCTTTAWNCLISRFVEDGNKRQQFSFSFPELWYSPLEFNSKKTCQHLTN